MNLDPRSSRNYKKSIERNKKANQGARFQVGSEILTTIEIAERVNCSPQTVNKYLRQFCEDPEKFIIRMRKKRKS